VAEAIARVNPYCVDLSSGVESSPGVKDPAKLRALFDAIRAATAGVEVNQVKRND
jgi:phosphoribosylanthranilate isomerase